MTKQELSQALTKLTEEILANNKKVFNLAIIGIRERGDVLAARIVEKIKSSTGVEVPLGVLDITVYRDDLGVNPQKAVIKKTDINFNLKDKTIVLVDDVLFTGRSVRAALDAITDFGRPKKIQLCVLIDRGLREFPIHADYVGKSIKTKVKDDIEVKLKESDEDEGVILVF